jgi:hypothetical protein
MPQGAHCTTPAPISAVQTARTTTTDRVPVSDPTAWQVILAIGVLRCAAIVFVPSLVLVGMGFLGRALQR